MQLFRVRSVIASFLLVSACAAAAAADDNNITSTPVTIATRNTPLKPLLNSNNRTKTEVRMESVLRGLLQVRQTSCPALFTACGSGDCCPTGGDCCTENDCCGTGEHCCSGGGCCFNGDDCATDSSTGERGCCPHGEVCRGARNAAMGFEAHSALHTSLVTASIIFLCFV